MKTRRSARENEHHHRANGKNGEKTTTKKKKNATRNRAWTRDEEDVEGNRARLTSGLLLDDAVPMEEHEKAQGEKRRRSRMIQSCKKNGSIAGWGNAGRCRRRRGRDPLCL